jgi:hypothetical protein
MPHQPSAHRSWGRPALHGVSRAVWLSALGGSKVSLAVPQLQIVPELTSLCTVPHRGATETGDGNPTAGHLCEKGSVLKVEMVA